MQTELTMFWLRPLGSLLGFLFFLAQGHSFPWARCVGGTRKSVSDEKKHKNPNIFSCKWLLVALNAFRSSEEKP